MKIYFKLLILWLALILTVPANAQSTQQLCYTSNGSNCIQSVAASKSVPINTNTATTTELVALSGTKSIFVTSFELVATAANTAKFVYGTGTACGTGQQNLTGAYGLTTFSILSKGNGLGAILFVPSGNALCIITTAAQQLSGSLSYSQF